MYILQNTANVDENSLINESNLQMYTPIQKFFSRFIHCRERISLTFRNNLFQNIIKREIRSSPLCCFSTRFTQSHASVVQHKYYGIFGSYTVVWWLIFFIRTHTTWYAQSTIVKSVLFYREVVDPPIYTNVKSFLMSNQWQFPMRIKCRAMYWFIFLY